MSTATKAFVARLTPRASAGSFGITLAAIVDDLEESDNHDEIITGPSRAVKSMNRRVRKAKITDAVDDDIVKQVLDIIRPLIENESE